MLIRFLKTLPALLLLGLTAHAEEGRFANVRVHPVNAILGEYAFDAAIAIAPILSIGPMVTITDMDIADSTAKGTGFGAQATLHLAGNRISDSWVLSAYFLHIKQLDLSRRELFTSTDFSGSFPNVDQYGLVAGYEWVYSSGFNLSVSAGVRHMNFPENYTLTSSGGAQMTASSGSASGFGPKMMITAGWAF
ncbi:MAG TPA: hypothetical protein VM598_08110 [Bdellovibrionota bacterium]|nr:hypothetical protein [Bdellovibrionota bacterium]